MSRINALPPQDIQQLLALDRAHLWHPYASMTEPPPVYPVVRADGVYLQLADGRKLLDGMASWWCAIHGYNHSALNQALQDQLQQMAHVMLGGITHPQAVTLCKKLVDITPAGLDKVFLCDSGSVAVEVAIKMAIQYWYSIGQPEKQRLLTVRSGYHGDTFAAMSVCDPVTGMHHMFQRAMPQQSFAPAPRSKFGQPLVEDDLKGMEQLLEQQRQAIAAVILEPIVQGTGGMNFYSADYLAGVRTLCDAYDVLLIADEIATGFGRSGKLFACEHAAIAPDIMCLGKALTGGYMSLAATLTCQRVSDGICNGEAGVFMHGPTFMGNPLACAVANASIDLLLSQDWQANILAMQRTLIETLAPAAELPTVSDVRVLGGIGVVEMRAPVDINAVQTALLKRGIWVRPFGKLVYVMPPYIMTQAQLRTLGGGVVDALQELAAHR